MKSTLLLSLLAWGLRAGNQQTIPASFASAVNVNSRYTVESVEVSGYDAARIGDPLRSDLRGLIGTAYDAGILDDLARRLRKQLHAKAVTQHLARGSSPDNVKVVFDVSRRSIGLDISVPKFLYHSKQGASALVEASTTIARNHNLSLGLVSDGDELTERFAGIRAAYENNHVASDRVRFRFLIEDYHEKWNRTTTDAIANPSLSLSGPRTEAPDIYRARQNFEPVLSVAVAGPFIFNIGASFERMEESIPSSRIESANALLLGLQYHKRFEESGHGSQTLDAGYDVRAATKTMGSDYVYARHHWSATYTWTMGRQSVSDTATAGFITGRAPLFDRFVVGTSSMLRGWNRYDIDPLGGDRLVHNSIDYRYRFADVFYDAGALWSSGRAPVLRHSLGFGVRQSVFTAAVAFPVREGRIAPVFLLGMNY